MATTQKKVRRSAALKILQTISAGKIFGVTFVTRGDCHSDPQLRTMSCAKGVTRHLRGGQQPYKPSDHGLMTVYEMLSPDAALARYRSEATSEIRKIDKRITDKQAALAKARQALAQKDTKKNRTSVDNKVRAIEELAAKRVHEELKLGPRYLQALRAEINARIERKQAEMTPLFWKTLTEPDAAEPYAEAVAALEREKASLDDPEETLRICYRSINLSGLTRLAVDGVEYTITTKPSPALPRAKSGG